jgi:hypothetical protein
MMCIITDLLFKINHALSLSEQKRLNPSNNLPLGHPLSVPSDRLTGSGTGKTQIVALTPLTRGDFT